MKDTGAAQPHPGAPARRLPAPPWSRDAQPARTVTSERALALRCRLASVSFVAAALMGASDSVSDIADAELSAALQRALSRASALCRETRDQLKEGA